MTTLKTNADNIAIAVKLAEKEAADTTQRLKAAENVSASADENERQAFDALKSAEKLDETDAGYNRPGDSNPDENQNLVGWCKQSGEAENESHEGNELIKSSFQNTQHPSQYHSTSSTHATTSSNSIKTFPRVWGAYGAYSSGVGGHGFNRPLIPNIRPRTAAADLPITIEQSPKFDRAHRTA